MNMEKPKCIYLIKYILMERHMKLNEMDGEGKE